MLSPILTVFRKEMIDHLRDRRSILVAMIYPLMGPILLGMMFAFVGAGMRVNDSTPLTVPVLHGENSPDLVRFLERQGATISEVRGDAWNLVSGGWLPFALVLPERQDANGKAPLSVQLISNPSKFESIVATGRIIEQLNAYQRETLRNRLGAAGLPPEMLDVIDVRQENIGRAAGPAVILLAMIPPFLIFTLFTGGVHVALDSTSGERERGSFEALMMNPVTRNQVLAGKLGATIVFTLMALAAQVAAFWVMLHSLSPETLGVIAPPDTLHLAIVVLICLPLVFLASAIQLLISAVTRSMKEAQTYLGLLPLVPGLAGMVLAMAPVHARPLLAAIPTFGQTLLMGQVVRSEAVSIVFIGITAVATLATTALLLYLGFRLYEREEILFPS